MKVHDDFYEEDEPLEDVLAAWDRNAANVHLTAQPGMEFSLKDLVLMDVLLKSGEVVAAEWSKYEPGSHECCCGNSECSDFEDRMAAMGIPLDELTVVEMTIPLGKVDDEQ